MQNLKEIETTLAAVFNPEQSHVLAGVIYDSYSHLATSKDLKELSHDFTELKEVVKDLAIAQKRTEMRVEELAEAQRRTEEAQRRTEEAQRRTEEAQRRTEKEIRNLARQVGGLSEALGGSLEDFAIDLVPELLEKYWGMKIEDFGRDNLSIGGIDIDFDLVVRGTLQGRAIVVLGEVKSNVTTNEVEKFIQITKSASDSLNAEVRVIFFGYRASKESRELIRASNAYMVFTHGKIL